MFCIIDTEDNHKVIKSGFKTAAQANNWAKKNLPKDEVRLWKPDHQYKWQFRYYVRMK